VGLLKYIKVDDI
jgi:hypothetical protein